MYLPSYPSTWPWRTQTRFSSVVRPLVKSTSAPTHSGEPPDETSGLVLDTFQLSFSPAPRSRSDLYPSPLPSSFLVYSKSLDYHVASSIRYRRPQGKENRPFLFIDLHAACPPPVGRAPTAGHPPPISSRAEEGLLP